MSEKPVVEATKTPAIPDETSCASHVYETRTKFIELEYEYLTQSSFHTDGLRNQIIQFYLIIASAAGTAVLGLAEIQAKWLESGQTEPILAPWVFTVIACFIGVIGVVMLPIFVRLRRLVLECLQGTVLLKRYCIREISRSGDTSFASSLLWDAHSLPTDEGYLKASFLLIFVVMLLDSGMFWVSAFLLLSERLSPPAAGVWSLAIGIAILTLQVVLYRWMLWYQIQKAMESDGLRDKWAKLMTEEDPALQAPALWRPALGALLIGGALSIVIAYVAWQLEPLTVVIKF